MPSYLILALSTVVPTISSKDRLRGDLKVSELESVRIHFLPILEEIGKCQNFQIP